MKIYEDRKIVNIVGTLYVDDIKCEGYITCPKLLSSQSEQIIKQFNKHMCLC
jgi:hypothetical protein